MAKNRKMPKKMSVVATTSMRFGAIIMFFFVMVILNLLSSSSCNQLLKARGEMERELAKLEEEYARQSSHWEQMKIPEELEKCLHGHGLKMNTPHPEQMVRMSRDGRPYPGQLSLRRAEQRGVIATPRVKNATASKRRRNIR